MYRVGLIVWAAAAALVVLVALPLAFVVLQAIFPALGQGSFAEPFGHVGATLADPQLLGLTGNTLILGAGVVVGAAALGVPLGVLRALYRVPLAALFDVILLVPFMIPPYIATLGWIMMLQRHGYLSQIAGFDAASFLYSVARRRVRDVAQPLSGRLLCRVADGGGDRQPLRRCRPRVRCDAVPGLRTHHPAARHARSCGEPARRLRPGDRRIWHAGRARPPERLRRAGHGDPAARRRLADRPAGGGDIVAPPRLSVARRLSFADAHPGGPVLRDGRWQAASRRQARARASGGAGRSCCSVWSAGSRSACRSLRYSPPLYRGRCRAGSPPAISASTISARSAPTRMAACARSPTASRSVPRPPSQPASSAPPPPMRWCARDFAASSCSMP